VLSIAILAVNALAHLQAPKVLTHGHAHNDYEHARPLFDALKNKFGSIEADVFLEADDLLVAHNRKDVTPEKSLRDLYLKPLAERIKENKGWVYTEQNVPVILLIDIKEEGELVYPILKEIIAEFKEFTEFPKAVKFVISGDRPMDLIKADNGIPAGIDGRFDDLKDPYTKEQMPLVSESWRNNFKWLGSGPMPQAEKMKLRLLVSQVHAQKRLLRFWATPDRAVVWEELRAAEVDLIGVDDLESFAKYWKNNGR